MLAGYQVIGPVGCQLSSPLTGSVYRLVPAPHGSTLAYVAVPDGAIGYFEPVYLLPGGKIESALTPDELRPP